MTQLACPFCGPRALREFEFHKTLPDAAQGSAFERTYERFTNLEYSVEHWQHVAGCRGWLRVERNPSSGAVLGIHLLGGTAP